MNTRHALAALVFLVFLAIGYSQDSTVISSTDVDESDVYLNVKNLTVQKVELNVQALHARVNLKAKLGKLLSINAGVEVDIKNTTLKLENVYAQVMLKVNLTNLYRIIDRTLQSVDKDSSLLTGIVDIANVLSSSTSGDLTTTRTVDQLGQVIERVSDSSGTVTSQKVVGDVSTMDVLSTTTNSAGQTVKRVQDAVSGVKIDVTYSTDSPPVVLNVKVVE
jgi:hypothetical protein